jgi:hypothetical protein
MAKRKRDKKTNNGQKKKGQKEQQWPKEKGAKRPTIAKRKRGKKTNNGQREKEQKDQQWVPFSFGHCWSFCPFFFWPLLVFLSLFLLAIVGLFVPFSFGHKGQKDQQWSKGKGTKRPTMVKRKRDKKTKNGRQNTTQKTKD